ncbi:PIN domain-containing protein [Pseudomonas sp. ODNR1LW]|nr:PIN domain-containing protein [Pseudomonas sp. ODNR1LW]
MSALLDTHVLYWLVSGTTSLSESALVAIAEAQAEDRLYVSPVTAWELGVAAQKSLQANRPDLCPLSPKAWFREAVQATGARIAPIRQRIALESAEVVTRTGHKDPGDCFLVATARVMRIPLVSRDAVMHRIARVDPDYLTVLDC